MTSWYHFDCFFQKQRPKGVGDVENFDQLRWDDQEKIKTKIESIDLNLFVYFVQEVIVIPLP